MKIYIELLALSRIQQLKAYFFSLLLLCGLFDLDIQRNQVNNFKTTNRDGKKISKGEDTDV